MSQQQGFTLIEAMVALAIAATALVVLMGRLGATAEIQHTLAVHALELDVASNELARQSMQHLTQGSEKTGTIETGGMVLHWRSWTEKTMLDGFVRRNIVVSAPGEAEVSLFLYQELR
ncbi:MAG: type II secretion system protein [Mariprofundus sp.]|nr:type II secretion system protein [Mariprofundus sp.]